MPGKGKDEMDLNLRWLPGVATAIPTAPGDLLADSQVGIAAQSTAKLANRRYAVP